MDPSAEDHPVPVARSAAVTARLAVVRSAAVTVRSEVDPSGAGMARLEVDPLAAATVPLAEVMARSAGVTARSAAGMDLVVSGVATDSVDSGTASRLVRTRPAERA